MPYKHRELKLSETQKRSTKLTTEQKTNIFNQYATGEYSQRQLASEYSVSRRLITFIIDPEKLNANIQRRKEKGGSTQYYNREKHTIATREHRRYKQDLYVKGELNQSLSLIT